MTPAAVLRVLVKADGLAKTAAEIEALDSDLQKARRTADSASGSFSKTGTDAKKMASGIDQAKSAVASANKELERTGRVSASTQKELSQLASRGVAGLDRDTRRMTQTVQKANDELAKHGTVSRRTARDLDRLGDGSGGAGRGIDFLRDAVDNLGGGFGRLGGALVGILPLLIGGLVALSGALFAVGAALGPLVGLAAAAAVGLLAAGQAAGVFALATMGIKDALKEQLEVQGKAAKAAISTAGQERSAARAIQAAQEGVRSAKDQVRKASEALGQAQRGEKYATEALSVAQRAQIAALAALGPARQAAKRDLEDMRSSLVRAVQDEQRAIMALGDARDALNRVLGGPDPMAMADAQDAVADAARGETQAVLNLAKARERLEDPTLTAADRAQATLDVADAENAIGDATRNRTKAEKALGDLQKGADPAEIAKARLDVAAAEQSVADATRDRTRQQQDTAEAEKAGIKGSVQMVAAREQLAAAERDIVLAQRALRDSHRQVTAAEESLTEASRNVTKALQGVRDAHLDAKLASAAAAAAAVDLNEKMGALPPAAQAFVKTLVALKPKLDEIRKVAAAGLFPGVTAGLNAAMGSFDSVKKVVGETATVMGGLAERAGELVGSKGFGKDLETIGGRNALIIDRIGKAAIYLTDALRHVLVAAGPLTTWLAKVTMEWARGAAQAAKAGRESGKLGEFFDSTRKTLVRVVSIIGNVATAFYEMGKVAAPSGRSILKSLDEISGRFATWTKSIGGQRALQNFFEESTKLSKQLMPALGGVLASVGQLAFHVMPAYVAILEALGPLAGPLIQMFILYKVALTAVAVATNLVAAAQWLWNAAMTANPIALVVVAIAALVAGIVVAYHESETFRKIVDGAWKVMKDVAAWIVTAGVAAWNAISHAVSDAWKWVKTATTEVWGFLRPYLTGVWTVLKTAVGLYFGAYKLIITTAWTVIKTVTETVWGAITTIATTAWTVLKTAAGIYWDGIKLMILTPIRAARDVLGNVWDAIKTVAATAWDGIKKAIKAGADPILDVILAPFKAAVKGVAKFAKLILQVIGKIPGVDTDGPVKAIDKFTEGLAKGGTFKAFARGGAFARTGGVVNTPITLMGEEAPRHPEFVIPTNPAYRKRAQMLLAKAAGAVGLAQGGEYGYNGTGNGPYMSQSQIIDLATRVKMPNPRLMAAIAMAESSGETDAFGPPSGKGLWQIEWNVWANKFAGMNPYDPMQNAAMAKAVLNAQGLNAWVAYSTGRHLPFYKDVSLGAKIGDIAGMLDPRKLIGQLPGVGDLPDWLKGTGKWVLEQAGGFIKDKLFGGGPGGVGGNVQKAIMLATGMGHPYPSDSQISGGEHAQGSLHYQGKAVDFGDAGQSVEKMQKLFMTLWGTFGKSINELFYDRMPWFVDNFQKVAGQFGGHMDHIHVGFQKGGIFGGLPFLGSFHNGGVASTEGIAHVSAGETMTPAGQGRETVVELHFANGMEFLRDFIDVRIVERDRLVRGAYSAGLVST